VIRAALLVCSTPLRGQWAELHFAEHNRAQSRTVAAIAERL